MLSAPPFPSNQFVAAQSMQLPAARNIQHQPASLSSFSELQQPNPIPAASQPLQHPDPPLSAAANQMSLTPAQISQLLQSLASLCPASSAPPISVRFPIPLRLLLLL